MDGERFTLGSYLRDRWATVFVGVICASGVAGMLVVLGNGAHASILGATFIVLCFAAVLALEYLRRRNSFLELFSLVESSLRPSQIQAIMSEPSFLEGRLYLNACENLVRKADEELLEECERSRLHREYVEAWTHEIKTPVAASRLVLAGMRGQEAAKLSHEIERIEQQVEAALYYARSSSLSNDYRISEVCLASLVGDALKRNSRFLIEKGVSPQIEVPEDLCILADETWTTFVLSQVVVNSAKYGASTIRFSAYDECAATSRGRTILEVADNGSGIPTADLPRVFDRGFTGANARSQGGSTGMGLYLSALLCRRMGLGLSIASEEGEGTRALISFPHDRSRMNLAEM